MRPDAPRDRLLQALTHEPSLGRLEMHAFLHRLCSRHVITLQNCLREPEWDRKAVEAESQADALLADPAWLAGLAERARWFQAGEAERPLVFAAGLLRALDRFHAAHRLEADLQSVSLPAALGGGETLFLPPPLSPLEDLVPPKRRLGRSQGDLENDLGSILHLSWHLVALEDLPVQPEVRRLPPLVAETLSHRLRQSSDLRIATAFPFAALDYVIRSDPDRCHAEKGTPYRFAEMEPLREGREILEEVLRDCAREKVDVLCFPELTLDTSLLSHLGLLLKSRNETLHPLLVMAGSFHVDAGLGRANRCHLLDGRGNLLLSQDKCTAYRIPADQAGRMRPEILAGLGIDERGGYEDIQSAETLHIRETPLGRLATPICLDFCGNQLRDLFIQTRVNLFLVPAMTPRMGPFYARAREFGSFNRATTIVVNSAWLLRSLGLRSRRHRALVYVPAWKGLRGGGRPLSDHLALFTIRELLGLS